MSRALLGGTALAVAAVVYALLLAALRRVDRAYPLSHPSATTWWFGYARDAANLLGFLMFSGGCALLGLPGHLALLLGATLALSGYGLDFFFARVLSVRRAEVATAATMVALSLLCAALRDPLGRALGALVAGLF
jgi:hypothetical protein